MMLLVISFSQLRGRVDRLGSECRGICSEGI